MLCFKLYTSKHSDIEVQAFIFCIVGVLFWFTVLIDEFLLFLQMLHHCAVLIFLLKNLLICIEIHLFIFFNMFNKIKKKGNMLNIWSVIFSFIKVYPGLILNFEACQWLNILNFPLLMILNIVFQEISEL